MKKLIFTLITLSLVYGCGTLSIEKRRYNKGFYVNWSQQHKKTQTPSSEESQDKSELATSEEHTYKVPTENKPVLTTDPVSIHSEEPVERTTFSIRPHEGHNEEMRILPTLKSSSTKSHLKRTIKRTETVHAQQIQKQSSRSINGMWFWSLLLTLPALQLFRNKVSSASHWAARNPLKGRWLIGLFTTTGLSSSFLLGSLFNWDIDHSMTYASMGLVGASGLLYATRFKSGTNFMKNKSAIAMMSMAGLSGSFGLGSHYGHMIIPQLVEGDNGMVLHPALAALFIFLLIVAMAASVFGLAMLACNLACSGYELLAGILFFGGAFASFTLGTYGILYVTRRKNEDQSHFWIRSLIIGGILTLLLTVCLFLLG